MITRHIYAVSGMILKPEPEVKKQPKWKCTLGLFPEETIPTINKQQHQAQIHVREVLNCKNAEMYVIVGHKLVYDVNFVNCASWEERDDCLQYGEPAVEISGPLLEQAYYKSIIIAFVTKVASKLGHDSCAIFFDPVEEITASIEPLWLPEIKQLQTAGSGLQMTNIWSFEVRSQDIKFYDLCKAAVAFVSERNNLTFNCTIEDLSKGLGLSYKLSGGIDRVDLESSFRTAINDFHRYLSVACFPHLNIPDISAVNFVANECFVCSMD